MNQMKILTYLVLLLLPALGQAQARFTQALDTTAMLIGDQQALHQYANSTDFEKDPLHILDTLSWMEILEVRPWMQSGDGSFKRDVLFTVFDSGSYSIPDYTVHFKGDSAQVNRLDLRVDFVRDSTNQLRAIKDIVETEGTDDFIWYALSGLLFVLVMLVLLYFLFKADQRTPGMIEYAMAEPADHKALKALAELDREKLWQKGAWKVFYDRLTDILRTYLSEGFYLPARESSTREIRTLLEAHQPAFRGIEELTALLNLADLVKFANLTPDTAQLTSAIPMAQEFIRHNAGMIAAIRQIHLLTYRRYLGDTLAEGFAHPDQEVDPGLQKIKLDGQTSGLVLISRLVQKHSFVLPDAWVRLHQQRMGLLNRWHHNLVLQGYPSGWTLLLLIPLLAIVSVFLPLLIVFSLWTKTRLISSGVFVLNGDRKLLVDPKSIPA